MATWEQIVEKHTELLTASVTKAAEQKGVAFDSKAQPITITKEDLPGDRMPDDRVKIVVDMTQLPEGLRLSGNAGVIIPSGTSVSVESDGNGKLTYTGWHQEVASVFLRLNRSLDRGLNPPPAPDEAVLLRCPATCTVTGLAMRPTVQ